MNPRMDDAKEVVDRLERYQAALEQIVQHSPKASFENPWGISYDYEEGYDKLQAIAKAALEDPCQR